MDDHRADFVPPPPPQQIRTPAGNGDISSVPSPLMIDEHDAYVHTLTLFK